MANGNPQAQDNSEEIANIKQILNSGVKTSSVDGETVTLDHDTLRKRLNELEREDAGLPAKPSLFGEIRFR